MGRLLNKTKILLMAFVIVAANLASVFVAPKTHAFPTGAQLPARAIRLSDSTPDGSAASYLVTFQVASAYSAKGIIVDFCSNSPVVGATCTLPTGFTIGASPTVTLSPTATGESFTALGSGWTAASANSNRTLKLTNSTGTSLSTGTTYAFAITGVHNPTANNYFFARIITYTSASGDIATYNPGTNDGSTDAKDYGGLAISTANNVNISARVPEQLQFCVSGAVMTSGCTSMSTPTLTLGHGTGSGAIVDASAVDTASAYMQVSTNASSGVIVRMKNLNTCTTGTGGLQRAGASVCDIPAVNSGGATAAAISAGTAAFGMNEPSAGVATGFTAPAPYTGTASAYGMDATTANQNVSSTYGSTILTSTGPSANSNTTMTFAATASATTPAGAYSATMVLICTGGF